MPAVSFLLVAIALSFSINQMSTQLVNIAPEVRHNPLQINLKQIQLALPI